MKKEYSIPNALAATTAIVYVVCRVLIGLFPDVSFVVAQSWFHGIELSQLGERNLTVGSFVLGIISSTVTAWVVGYIFVAAHKAFSK